MEFWKHLFRSRQPKTATDPPPVPNVSELAASGKSALAIKRNQSGGAKRATVASDSLVKQWRDLQMSLLKASDELKKQVDALVAIVESQPGVFDVLPRTGSFSPEKVCEAARACAGLALTELKLANDKYKAGDVAGAFKMAREAKTLVDQYLHTIACLLEKGTADHP
jgi:hypothetical protein